MLMSSNWSCITLKGKNAAVAVLMEIYYFNKILCCTQTKLTAALRPAISSKFIELLGEHEHLGHKFEYFQHMISKASKPGKNILIKMETEFKIQVAVSPSKGVFPYFSKLLVSFSVTAGQNCCICSARKPNASYLAQSCSSEP